MTVIGSSLGSTRPPVVVLHAAGTLPPEVLSMLAPTRSVQNILPADLSLIDSSNTSRLVRLNTPDSWLVAETRRSRAGQLRTWPASDLSVEAASGDTVAPVREDTVISSLCSEIEATVQAGWGTALLLESTGCVPRTPCIAAWSDDSVSVRLPPGQGGRLNASIYVEQLSEWGPTGFFYRAQIGIFSYFAPGLSVVEPTPFDGNGADLVIMGSNLGHDSLLFDPASFSSPSDLA